MRKGISLLEILITLTILGILLASITMATSAIYKSGQNMPGIVPLSKIASTLENVFQRNLRGIANQFTVSDDGRRVDFIFSKPGGQQEASFVFDGDELWYDPDISTPETRERVADGIHSIEFTRVNSDVYDQQAAELVRLGVDIQLVSGERIVTTVTGRQESEPAGVVD